MVGMGDPVGTPTTSTGGESGTGANDSNPTGVPGSPELPPTPKVEKWVMTRTNLVKKGEPVSLVAPLKTDGKFNAYPITYVGDEKFNALGFGFPFNGYLLRTYTPTPSISVEVWAVMDEFIGDKVRGYLYIDKPGKSEVKKYSKN